MFTFLRRMVKTAAILLAVSLAASYAADKVKIGMYVDTGVGGAGVMGWAKILSNSPQVELILLDVADIRGGKLRECDVLLMPGGSTGREFRALGKDGVEAIRKYVAEGGKYIGVCAGWASDVAAGAKAAVTAFDWAGLLCIALVLPALLSLAFSIPLRRAGWIRPGDMKL